MFIVPEKLENNPSWVAAMEKAYSLCPAVRPAPSVGGGSLVRQGLWLVASSGSRPSAPSEYTVEFFINSESGRIKVVCSCPAGRDGSGCGACYHAAAALVGISLAAAPGSWLASRLPGWARGLFPLNPYFRATPAVAPAPRSIAAQVAACAVVPPRPRRQKQMPTRPAPAPLLVTHPSVEEAFSDLFG